MVDRLEPIIDDLTGRFDPPTDFVVPGANRISALLDLARTVVRRAERRVVACVDAGQLSGEHLLPWLNRLSDVLFVLARSVERRPRSAR
jgi:cob(I)alamin adenosyltransferase